MMRKYVISLSIILALLIASLPGALAQDSGPYPAIISFTSSLDQITVADAEAGETSARLSWQIVGLGDQQRVLLYVYQFNEWKPLLADDAPPLPATGDTEVTVTHPLNFGPPTYNLMVTDASGQVLDQRILMIPYALAMGEPEIAEFSAGVQSVDVNAVGHGSAQIAVSWEVTNRAPFMNLVFEQMLDSDRAVSVELPRPNLWVPSQGEGMVAPVLPSNTANHILLRLRVIDVRDGSTLAEQDLPPIAMVGRLTPPTAAPTQPVPAVSTARIVSFTATPESVQPGGSVTISWEVANTAQLGVWLLDTAGRLSVSGPASIPRGSWTVTLTDAYTTNARFMIFASDASGQQTQASLTVNVACPFTYFFSTTSGMACPASDPFTVQAAFQTFEHGNMMWRADTGEILVLYDDGRVGAFRDTWQGETLIYPDTPPEGLYPPDRGFGRVWVDNPDVRSGLGWAVTLEQGYTMTIQPSSGASGRLYMTWPDGTVIHMDYAEWGYQ